MLDGTRKFSMKEESNKEMKRVLQTVYDATYITNYNNARSLIRKIDRDELMQELISNYLDL